MISLQEPHHFWKKKHYFETHARNKCAAVLKVNQFIEPKATFAGFLKEGMKNMSASILGGWNKKSWAQLLKSAKTFTRKKL